MGSISALLVIIATMLLTGFFAGSETAVISCSSRPYTWRISSPSRPDGKVA